MVDVSGIGSDGRLKIWPNQGQARSPKKISRQPTKRNAFPRFQAPLLRYHQFHTIHAR